MKTLWQVQKHYGCKMLYHTTLMLQHYSLSVIFN